MNNFFIYKIVFPKGKHYIGCSENLDERKKTHRKDTRVDKPKKIVHKALKKFNMMDTFQLIVIDTANSKQEMFEKEKFYIQQYNSYYKNKKGYNNTLGGEGNHGYVFTKADRKKMSQRQKEYYQNNPEAGKVRGEKMKALYENNPEQRQKARERALQQYSDPEARKKQSQRAIRQFSNPEARKSEKRRKLFKVFRKHNMEFIKEFEFQFEAIEYIKKEFNINVSSKISAVLRNREKSAKGFVFEYV